MILGGGNLSVGEAKSFSVEVELRGVIMSLSIVEEKLVFAT